MIPNHNYASSLALPQLPLSLSSLIHDSRPNCSTNLIKNEIRKKVQKPLPDTAQFPCNPHGPGGRSEHPPMSAHSVRPGDIDIIAAIGDSLTAGNGMYMR